MSNAEITCIEFVIENELKQGHTQSQIAETYRMAMCMGRGKVDWTRTNKAIIDRWSMSGLMRVKKLAHKG